MSKAPPATIHQDPSDNPRTARQTALLAIHTMILCIIFLNLVYYSIITMIRRLSTSTTTNPDSSKSPQDWQIEFLTAPATIKLWFAASVFVGLCSYLVLNYAFVMWAIKLALVSVKVRNYALGYGVSAGLGGLLTVRFVVGLRWNGEGSFLMSCNGTAGPLLMTLWFGTMYFL